MVIVLSVLHYIAWLLYCSECGSEIKKSLNQVVSEKKMLKIFSTMALAKRGRGTENITKSKSNQSMTEKHSFKNSNI